MFKLLAGIFLIWLSRQTDLLVNAEWGWISTDLYTLAGIALSAAGLDTIFFRKK